MNATTEVNSLLLKLIQYLQQQVATLVTTNNRTNPPNSPNPRNPSNPSNPQNQRRCNTRKYYLSRRAFSHTSMYCNMKTTGHKYAELFCDKMEGGENYCPITAE